VASVGEVTVFAQSGVAFRAKAVTKLVITRFCKINKPPSPFHDTVSGRIRYFRLSKNLSQKILAKRAKISENVISRYEQSKIKKINPQIILKIAKSLDIPAKKLLPSYTEDFFKYFIKPDGLGSRIKYFRIKQGITQKEFAQKLNLSRETIRRYEKGITKPDKKTVEKMAKILKVSVRSLVNGKGGKKK